MTDLLKEREQPIRIYFEQNQLDFDKAVGMPRSCLGNSVFIRYCDPILAQKQVVGLMPPAPAPIMLKIWVQDDKLLFEQTEHTEKYLKLK